MLWLQVVANAKVPIIKFVEVQSNINFDISFDVANGPIAAGFVRDLMDTLPPMKPLVLVLKIFLQQRSFNEVGQRCYSAHAGHCRCFALMVCRCLVVILLLSCVYILSPLYVCSSVTIAGSLTCNKP